MENVKFSGSVMAVVKLLTYTGKFVGTSSIQKRYALCKIRVWDCSKTCDNREILTASASEICE